jgi:hypothetical protein
LEGKIKRHTELKNKLTYHFPKPVRRLVLCPKSGKEKKEEKGTYICEPDACAE